MRAYEKKEDVEMIGITINLDSLKRLLVQYCDEQCARTQADDNDMARRLLFSDFILWLRRQQDGTQEVTTDSGDDEHVRRFR